MNIKKDSMYQEGYWAGRSVAENIEKTVYKDIKTAISVKSKVVEHFEDKFKYNRNMEEYDTNYSYNVGMLDYLKEYSEECLGSSQGIK